MYYQLNKNYLIKKNSNTPMSRTRSKCETKKKIVTNISFCF